MRSSPTAPAAPREDAPAPPPAPREDAPAQPPVFDSLRTDGVGQQVANEAQWRLDDEGPENRLRSSYPSCWRCTQPSKILPWTWLLHFLLVEMRAVYIFYFSARDLILKVGVYDTTYGQPLASVSTRFPEYNETGTVGDIVDTIEELVWSAMWQAQNIAGLYNLGCLAVVALFVVVNTILLIWQCPSCCGGGDYLAFTWHLERTWCFRASAAIMLCYVFVALFLSFGVSFQFLTLPGLLDELVDPFKLIQIAWQDILLIVVSVVSIMVPREPIFGWKQESFKDLNFKRSWYSFFMETNDMFASEIASALIQAQMENKIPLESLLEDPAHVEIVMGTLLIAPPAADDVFDTAVDAFGSMSAGGRAAPLVMSG